MMNDDLRGHSLLAIFAHPDDESLACGGLLAWCAHLGASVSVCCATGGELGSTAGMCASPPPEPADIRRVRLGELRNAARTLGVTNLVVLDHEDGMLPWIGAEQLEADLGSTIRRLHPDVVITFGDDGLYGHPDHVAIHERTTASVAALGNDAPALYYVTMPIGAMRAVAQHVAMADKILGIEVDAFGTCAAAATLVVDVGPFAASKLAAIKCHRTQVANDALDLLTAADAERLIGTEHFHRAGVGRRGDTFLERFDAVRPKADATY
jgi:N-acetyl-1-D-myo-inositol-2-amino-2-deoxy-alpha-D-glucopyranoside deacetylase